MTLMILVLDAVIGIFLLPFVSMFVGLISLLTVGTIMAKMYRFNSVLTYYRYLEALFP